jgi:hypothetical protein
MQARKSHLLTSLANLSRFRLYPQPRRFSGGPPNGSSRPTEMATVARPQLSSQPPELPARAPLPAWDHADGRTAGRQDGGTVGRRDVGGRTVHARTARGKASQTASRQGGRTARVPRCVSSRASVRDVLRRARATRPRFLAALGMTAVEKARPASPLRRPGVRSAARFRGHSVKPQ